MPVLCVGEAFDCCCPQNCPLPAADGEQYWPDAPEIPSVDLAKIPCTPKKAEAPKEEKPKAEGCQMGTCGDFKKDRENLCSAKTCGN